MMVNPHNRRLLTRRLRLCLLAFVVLLLFGIVSVVGAASSHGLHAEYAPSPTRPGRAVLAYATGADTGGWWLWRCGPQDGACTLIRRGAGIATGAIEEFQPAGVRYSLRGYVNGAYTVRDVDAMGAGWSWVLLVGVRKE